MSKNPVTQPQDKYVLRLPDGMRDKLKAAAEANNRSMNAEIVARLDESFEAETKVLAIDSASRLVSKMRSEVEDQLQYYKRILEHERELSARLEERERELSDERIKYKKLSLEVSEDRKNIRQDVEKTLREELSAQFEKQNARRLEKLDEKELQLRQTAERLEAREKELFAAIQALSRASG